MIENPMVVRQEEAFEAYCGKAPSDEDYDVAEHIHICDLEAFADWVWQACSGKRFVNGEWPLRFGGRLTTAPTEQVISALLVADAHEVAAVRDELVKRYLADSNEQVVEVASRLAGHE